MANTSHFHKLREKWLERHKHIQKKVWDHHKKALNWFSEQGRKTAINSVSGLMLLSSPSAVLLQPPPPVIAPTNYLVPISINQKTQMIEDLKTVLPKEVDALSSEQEEKVAAILSRDFNMKVGAELEGKRLNRSYGFIGAEQHLARYPGDSMASHFENPQDSDKYYSSGMAPGLGAWGYFARSAGEMTEKDSMREKYYIATQTFLAPGFHDNVRDYITFFKHRKMLVVNPENGKAMVVVIGDAGPAAWTGKHLGGSPEVMKYLERVDGRQKGPVLYFFIDDPSDTIPLGPIQVNEKQLSIQ